MSRGKLWSTILIILIVSVFVGLIDWPGVPGHWPLASLWNKLDYKLGLDLQGGAHLVYEADTSTLNQEDAESALQGVRDVIEKRVNAFGVSEPIVQTNKAGDSWRVIVELAGVFDVNEAITQIGETPILEFKEENPEASRDLTEEEKQQLEKMNDEVRQSAQEVLGRSKQGEDFAELAKKFSDDPGSTQNGGALGLVGRGNFVPEFETAAFSQELKTGEVFPELVKSNFGYHIIKKLDEQGEGDDKKVNVAHILFASKT